MTDIATKKDIEAAKRYVRDAFLDLCGFAPKLKDINILDVLLFCAELPQYVTFSVGDHIYSYDGITMETV